MKEYEIIKQEQIRRLEEKLGIKIDIEVEPDIEEFNEAQLEEYLADLEDRLGELEDNEPDDTGSDEYDEWEEKSHVNETLEWMINNNTEIMGSRELEVEIVDAIDADKEACLFDFKSTIWDFSPLKKYLMMLVSIEKQGV